jgi:hypothetical protein
MTQTETFGYTLIYNEHSDELHNSYSSPNIITVITSRRMRWKGHFTLMGKMRNTCKVLVGKLERARRNFRYQGVFGKIILK